MLQQLDGEEGVPFGVVVDRRSERRTQLVGFDIKQGIDEPPALGLLGQVQVDGDRTKIALELGQHFFQGMALALP